MNTLSNSQFIRKKPTIDTIFELQNSINLSNPREDLKEIYMSVPIVEK